MTQLEAKELTLESSHIIPEIFGPNDDNLNLIEKKFKVRITTRENLLTIKGSNENIEAVDSLFTQLQGLLSGPSSMDNGDIKFAIRLMADNPKVDIKSIFNERISVPSKKGFITPKGPSQRDLIHSIRTNDIVISVGPAGTGKTYISVAMAVDSLLQQKHKRIILVRPAVEAGEKLGYLPGDISEKIDPYLMPLYDALRDMLDPQRVQQMIEEGFIEIAPLAYMRGRTLNDSFIILDEAQNSTREQMKMFLTRLGFRSKMVITGDVTQIDLPKGSQSGLIHARDILKKIKGIRFIHFNENDVVRHELVKKIIMAYDV
ncbi:MAG: PhoH family protein [Nitrospinales bacterium]